MNPFIVVGYGWEALQGGFDGLVKGETFVHVASTFSRIVLAGNRAFEYWFATHFAWNGFNEIAV